MSNSYNSDLPLSPDASSGGVIRVERVWQHRHDIDLTESKRYHARLAAVGAVGLVLGLVCSFFFEQQFPKSDLVPTDQLKAVTATREQFGEHRAEIQKAADASAISAIVEMDIASAPVVAVPSKRPVRDELIADKAREADGAGAAMPADVIRFDRCSPKCETRDPLIIGSAPHMPPPENVASNLDTDEQEPSSSALQGAGYVLGGTASLPFTALRLGRHAVGGITGVE
ncbi:hypothetical protein G6M87_32365 (plasmid) [Rhizobium rhizogenes]|uniref:hypothetical protein n=1 Tax=Rhizobium rhizogenes TaxID=359 RepID=UPI00157200F7|nr:hypothetical protein [Rhizobium rhizogenes]NTI26910.1 hypothetical protein [Rhizobium rhizogenes]QTG10240.1 hypothetical protein G6M87_32365 [Rhizobium rhizogenes]